MMATENRGKCGGLILEAIDQLRKRKARPDLDRICHMLERKHGFNSLEVNEELKKLVKDRVVIKVDYKGNTSYRNAAKWVKTKAHFYGSFYSSSDISSDISSAVLEAVRVLTMPTPNQTARSASVQAIEQYLLKRDSQSNLNLATLRSVLEKEVEQRHLHQLQNGEFIPMRNHLFSPPEDSPSKTPPDSKKFKSDTESHENSSNSSEELNRCDYCLFTSSANRKGEPEEILVCRDCGAKAHATCMEYTTLLYEKYPNPQDWQCPDCKTCSICDETNISNDLLICYICFNGYHMRCHDPVITQKPTDVWFCFKCDKSVEKVKAAKNKHSSPVEDISFCSASDTFKEGFQKSMEEYPSSVPVAKKWSIDNVEAFFRFIGFEDEATAFRKQEIDGLSLLLMKRNDVLTGLGIKLGPALKIYKHIVNLQSRIIVDS